MFACLLLIMAKGRPQRECMIPRAKDQSNKSTTNQVTDKGGVYDNSFIISIGDVKLLLLLQKAWNVGI